MAPVSKYSGVLLALLFLITILHVVVEGGGQALKRQKREWYIYPKKLQENVDYTGLAYIAKIRSDKDYKGKVTYSLTGHGVDKDPVGLYVIDANEGLVRITRILDREAIPYYILKGIAKYSNGSRAEKDLELRIDVVDMNDCAPVFQMGQVGSVYEASAAGTVIMRVNATDADEGANAQIYFSLVESSSTAGMFSINHQTGEVMVRQNTLDRETRDTYTLTVRGADMNGAAGGNSATADIVIKLLDINDNIPTLERETYEGHVQENTINVEVMRIKAIDLDMAFSASWEAVFSIMSGNEAGYFSITTDQKTNEGIIMINKALDYEELKVLNLAVSVSNKAEYNFGSSSIRPPSLVPKTYPIKINVVNQVEPPRFHPAVKVVTISEDISKINLHQIITNYAAIDSDTLQIATNVRYAKLKDINNWLIIDEKTADIRLAKLPDRESKYLINGTYYAEIICITSDLPTKTATGTIAIQVEDANDDCPTLTSTSQTVCYGDSVVYVTAVDHDEFPNSAPFEFMVIQGGRNGKWTVDHINETSAILRNQASLWPGQYKIAMEITDQQGKSCGDVQVMDVVVCTCEETETTTTKTCVPKPKGATFGAPGVLLMLLGLLLLLLVPLLLLFCLCGGAAAMGNFKAIPFDTKEQLISYYTEGQGEDREVPLLQIPTVDQVDHGIITAKDVSAYGGGGGRVLQGGGAGGGGSVAGGGGMAAGGGGLTSSSMLTTENMQHYQYYHNRGEHGEMDQLGGGGLITGGHEYLSRYGAGAYDGMALSEDFLQDYYSSKADHAAQHAAEKDALRIYDYEGQESLAGSVGCCSLLDNDNSLDFLDDLGPKFKFLADICQGTTLEAESVEVSVRPARPVSPPRPSTSTHSHTHTHSHTETTRDREHVGVGSLNTSNVATGTSAVVQDRLVSERAQGSVTMPRVHVQDNILIPSQTLLIQQPTMYYAATPMYVVENQPQMVLVAGGDRSVMGLGQGQGSQGMVLVAGGDQSVMGLGQGQGSQGMVLVAGGDQSVMGLGQGQGSQGMVLVAGGDQSVMGLGQGQGSQGMVLVAGGDQSVMGLGQGQGSQGMVLVGTLGRQVGVAGGAAGHVVTGLSQTIRGGSGSSQGGGQALLTTAEHHAGTAPGFAQGSNISRSRQVRVVETSGSASSGVVGGGAGLAQVATLQTGSGSAEQGLGVRGQGVEVKGQSVSLRSTGSAGASALEPTALQQGSHRVEPTALQQGSHRVVVQSSKKISVTESNIETSTRA